MDQLPLVTEDGKILLGGSEIDVPNVVLDCRIGDGANGVVFKGRHKYLQRDVAVKIWLKLREKDKRDKFRQGVFEPSGLPRPAVP